MSAIRQKTVHQYLYFELEKRQKNVIWEMIISPPCDSEVAVNLIDQYGQLGLTGHTKLDNECIKLADSGQQRTSVNQMGLIKQTESQVRSQDRHAQVKPKVEYYPTQGWSNKTNSKRANNTFLSFGVQNVHTYSFYYHITGMEYSWKCSIRTAKMFFPLDIHFISIISMHVSIT